MASMLSLAGDRDSVGDVGGDGNGQFGGFEQVSEKRLGCVGEVGPQEW